jgi:Ca-activated chloride channel family protein
MEILFLRPQYLLLLFVVPLLIAIHFVTLKSKKQEAILFANFEAISRIKGIDIYSKNIFILALSIAMIFFMVLGISGLTFKQELYSESFSFVVAIDNSQSMSANDMLPTRLDAAKRISSEFVDSAKIGTKIGVVSFSGNAVIEQGLSDDKDIVNARIREIVISNVGGTDIDGAVNAAVRVFGDEENKALILLSDGQINTGDINDSLDNAVKRGIVINTIALGTLEGGEAVYGMSKLNEDVLKAFAFNTGGRFFKAGSAEELKKDFESISSSKLTEVNINLSNYLFFAAIIIFVIEFVLINTRYRSIP